MAGNDESFVAFSLYVLTLRSCSHKLLNTDKTAKYFLNSTYDLQPASKQPFVVHVCDKMKAYWQLLKGKALPNIQVQQEIHEAGNKIALVKTFNVFLEHLIISNNV